MSGLRAFGYEDCFRAVNGYDVDAPSWYWRQRGVIGGFRLDHVFVSASLQTSACWYEHGFREARLSDHSPIVADINFS
jgi:exonuclease III